ncbi:MAG TPA: pilus assembly protein TadG-related protein [Hyphomicrobiales bacterium]|nr:pilus assembly protein TadG-related protein [Hyphomicrobiales bacterium]
MAAIEMARARRRFLADRGGNVAMLAAGGMAVVLGAAALGVDLGSIYDRQRDLQSAADLAAIAAAADLPRAERAAAATVRRNAITLTAPLAIETGTYRADRTLAPADRFVPADASVANAARVSLTSSTSLFFGRALLHRDRLTLTATATAAQASFASFAIGSRLAALDGGVLNAVLGASLGMNLSLSLMDYQALAATTIDLPSYLRAVAGRAHLSAATYDQVLASNVGAADAVAALADAAAASATPTAAAALAALQAAAAASTQAIGLAGLADLGPYGAMALDATPSPGVAVSALDLLDAMATIADGKHQVAVGLDLGLPGIAAASLQLAIGERPQGTSWVTVGAAGATVETAQTRLLLTLTLAGSGQIAAVTLPLYLDLAAATATLGDLNCAAAGDDAAVTLDVTPAVADAWIGTVPAAALGNFAATPAPAAAPLVALPPLTISGSAHAAMTNPGPTAVDFSADDIAADTRKTVSTTDYASLVTTLLGNLDLSVALGGLTVPLPGQTGATIQAIATAAAPSINAAVGGILGALGIGLGQADVWVGGRRCNGAVLVN